MPHSGAKPLPPGCGWAASLSTTCTPVRVAAFLNELRKKDYRRVAVFAHGGVLICAQVYAGAIPLEDGFKHLTSYGGVVKINI